MQRFFQFTKHYSTMSRVALSELDNIIIQQVRKVLPKLDAVHHKGQHGRIGIIGGSLEYTGAPYFAGISALRVGADLVHVFCAKDAAQPIKSYSPDLIVHPLLDRPDAVTEISKWLERLHVIVIGPGLGDNPLIVDNVKELLASDVMKQKRLVIDADGLKLIEYIDTIPGLVGIMTPNAIEAQRLNGLRPKGFVAMFKGPRDEITNTDRVEFFGCDFRGTGRRCGGQGDLLSGSIATLYHWAVSAGSVNPEVVACQGAGLLVRLCNYEAVQVRGRGALAVDMIDQIPLVFKNYFETE